MWYSLSDEKLKLNDIRLKKGCINMVIDITTKRRSILFKQTNVLRFSEVQVWLFITRAIYCIHLWGSIPSTTCLDLQKRRFYNPVIQSYQKCNH